MKQTNFFEYTISHDFKDPKKKPEINFCSIFYSLKKDPTYENFKEYMKKEAGKKYKKHKKLDTLSKINNESVQYSEGVIKLLDQLKGKIKFEPNFQGYSNYPGIQLETEDSIVKIYKRNTKLTSWNS